MQRMRLIVVVVVVLGVVAPAPAVRAAPWEPRIGVAAAWADDRAGEVSIAVLNPAGRYWRSRAGRVVPAASVLKVMFMVAYLRQPSVRDRPLRDSDRDLLRPMIRRSANDPATAIANMLGPGPMNRLAERAGMRDFRYTRPWGLTSTSARDQVRFLYRLREFIPNRHEPYAMWLLASIVDSQRWGIGEVSTPGWRKNFKGGWGSGSGAVDHQVVLLEADGRRIGLAVMTTNSPSHDYGKNTLRGVFARLLRDLPPG